MPQIVLTNASYLSSKKSNLSKMACFCTPWSSIIWAMKDLLCRYESTILKYKCPCYAKSLCLVSSPWAPRQCHQMRYFLVSPWLISQFILPLPWLQLGTFCCTYCFPSLDYCSNLLDERASFAGVFAWLWSASSDCPGFANPSCWLPLCLLLIHICWLSLSLHKTTSWELRDAWRLSRVASGRLLFSLTTYLWNQAYGLTVERLGFYTEQRPSSRSFTICTDTLVHGNTGGIEFTSCLLK